MGDNRLTEVYVHIKAEYPNIDTVAKRRLKEGVTEQEAIDRLFEYETMGVDDWAYMIRKKLAQKEVERGCDGEMHCPDCNAAVMDYEAKFCVYCGRALRVKPEEI